MEQHKADLRQLLQRATARAANCRQYLDGAGRATAGASSELLLKELADLRANLDHIKEIVAMQQTYARRCGVLETVAVDGAGRGQPAHERRRADAPPGAREARLSRTVPQITVDKHKVLQILVNLIRNAKYACDESGARDKQVTVRIESVPDGRTHLGHRQRRRHRAGST